MNVELRNKELRESQESGTFSDILRGAVAGLMATIPMTVSMLLMHRFLPKQHQHPLPPREITETAVNKAEEKAEEAGAEKHLDEQERTTATWVSHFAYGASVGALYAPVAKKIPMPLELSGIAFGLTVWAGSYLGWLPAMHILHPEEEHPSRHALMIAAHVVWGSSMGALLGDSKREAL